MISYLNILDISNQEYAIFPNISYFFNTNEIKVKCFSNHYDLRSVFFSEFKSFAQNYSISEIQGLEQKLNKKYRELNRLDSLITVYWNVSSDSAAKYINKGLNLSKQIKDSAHIAFFYDSYGNYYNDQRVYEKSIKYLDTAYSFYVRFEDTTKMAEVLIDIGVGYSRLGKYDKELEATSKALVLLENEKDSFLLYSVCNNLGTFYLSTGELDKAESFLNRALKITKSLKLSEFSLVPNLNLGNIAQDEKQFSKAIMYYKEVYRIADSLNVPLSKGLSQSNMAYTFFFNERL